jgi:hypothetical protein
MRPDERRHSVLGVVAEATVSLGREVQSRTDKPLTAVEDATLAALKVLSLSDSRQHRAFPIAVDVASVGLETRLVVCGHAPYPPSLDAVAEYLVREVSTATSENDRCNYERAIHALLALCGGL